MEGIGVGIAYNCISILTDIVLMSSRVSSEKEVNFTSVISIADRHLSGSQFSLSADMLSTTVRYQINIMNTDYMVVHHMSSVKYMSN